MKIERIEVPGDQDGSLGHFVLAQVQSCVADLFKIPTNAPGAVAEALYQATVARTILVCLAKAGEAKP
jgi:hypothetical protein